MKNQINAFEEGDLKPHDVTKIATDLGVTEDEVVSMNRRMAMGGDTSLNVSLKGDEGGESQWQDFLVDHGPLQDEALAEVEVDHKRFTAAKSHARRTATLNAAFLARPERFRGRRPYPPSLPARVWINQPPATLQTATSPQTTEAA
jgi:hypothetical protein